jgi:hypothetical protein
MVRELAVGVIGRQTAIERCFLLAKTNAWNLFASEEAPWKYDLSLAQADTCSLQGWLNPNDLQRRKSDGQVK